MSNVRIDADAVAVLDEEYLASLKRDALAAPLLRARVNLHTGPHDPVQEMIIAINRGSLVRPHRHRAKPESYHIIEGEALVVSFDDLGRVSARVKLGAKGLALPFFLRINDLRWHTLIPLSEWVIVHETTAGPYSAESSEYPSWAPHTEDALRVFLARCCDGVGGTGP